MLLKASILNAAHVYFQYKFNIFCKKKKCCNQKVDTQLSKNISLQEGTDQVEADLIFTS